MIHYQYAVIPIKYLKIKKSPEKCSFFSLFKFLKPKDIIVKVSLDENPFIEEIITERKIGLSDKDDFKVYLLGDAIYENCSKKEAYLIACQIKNYEENVIKLFMD